jgi:outer membrane lipoprotein SlyB
MRLSTIAALTAAALSFSIVSAEAKGCIKGAIVGGVAGHLVGHGKVGAAAGCAIGHHNAAKKDADTPANQGNAPEAK